MAAREFFVSVKNFTGKRWDRGDVRLPHGKWSEPNGFPSEHVGAVHLDEAGDVVPGDAMSFLETTGSKPSLTGSQQESKDLLSTRPKVLPGHSAFTSITHLSAAMSLLPMDQGCSCISGVTLAARRPTLLCRFRSGRSHAAQLSRSTLAPGRAGRGQPEFEQSLTGISSVTARRRGR
jgi:hypothetical protein